MPNWDDQFDFDDLDNNKAKAKPAAKTKKTTNDDDEFFDDDTAPKKQAKSILPSINTRNSAKSNKPLVQTPKMNPFANKSFGSKQMNEDDFEQDFEQEIAQQPKPKQQPAKVSIKQIKPAPVVTQTSQGNKKKPAKQDDYDDEFYQQDLEEPLQKSVDNKNKSKNSQKVLSTQPSKTVAKAQPQSIKPVPAQTKPAKQEEDDEYGEDDDFENDGYADDNFEEEAKSPAKKAPIKVNQLLESNPVKANTKLSIKATQLPKTIEASQKDTSIKPPVKQDPPKAKQIQARSQSVVPPKPPGGNKNSKETVSTRNINKVESNSVSKPMKRSASRQSIRSNDNKSMKGSRISERNESQFLPNKHITLVAKSFPHDQDKLNLISQLQINKINEKMRAMIRKFNEELNDLISKNMLLLKNKSIDKHMSLDERIRELEIQKKSGDTAIEVMEKDFDKLHGREGELKEEEYQLILQKQIEETKSKIKQVTKQITVVKRQVDNKGKKLSLKQAEQHNAQNITHLKGSIIQARKEQEKGQQRIQKLISTYEELETKISDIDYKLDELISEAKQKGVNIQNTGQLSKKYEELKSRFEAVKNFNSKAESLNSTKLQILNHENDQVRISIRNVHSQISNLYGSIDHSQTQAIKLIEKAKEKTGISPLFAESLEKLQKQLEESRHTNDHDYFDARSQIKSRRSDSTKVRHQKTSNDEIQKSMPLRVTQSQNQILENAESTVKPKFMKKKPVEQAKLDIENKSKVNERVWNQDIESNNNSKASVNDQNKQKVTSPSDQSKQIQEQVQKDIVVEQEKKDKSKPFMLKKNRASEAKAQEIKQKHPVVEEKLNIQFSLPIENKNNQQTKKEDNANINLAPRMMRFSKKKNEETPSQNSFTDNSSPKDNPKPIELIIGKKEDNAKLQLKMGGDKASGLSLDISQPPKNAEEDDKPIFVPKRFNLRGRTEKKEDSYVPNVVQKDNSYTSSVENQANVVKAPVIQKEQKKQDYQPKFNFKDEEPIKNPFKKEPEAPLQQPQPEIKPKFNLRLRDKQSTNNDSYEPLKATDPQLNLNANSQSSVGPGQANLKMQSKPVQNQFVVPKQNLIKANDTEIPKNNPYNPYAPKVEPSMGIKQNIEPKKEEFTINKAENINSNNPYANKFQSGSQQAIINEAPKRQRGGPLKKNKISANMPKQSFNIYAQADDITNQVKEIGAKTVNQDTYNIGSSNAVNNAPLKSDNQKLSINDMLGIKKEVKKNDFSDLLGDIGVANTKNKKKNNDFFNDLDL